MMRISQISDVVCHLCMLVKVFVVQYTNDYSFHKISLDGGSSPQKQNYDHDFFAWP